MTDEEFYQRLEDKNIELVRDNPDQSTFSIDGSLEVQVIDEQYDRMVLRDTIGGEIVQELQLIGSDPNFRGDEFNQLCGTSSSVESAFFSPDGKYLVAINRYCGHNIYRPALHMWVVPDTAAEE